MNKMIEHFSMQSRMNGFRSPLLVSEKTHPDKDPFFALQDEFQAALEHLGQEDSDAVREYIEYLFHRSAGMQAMLCKAAMVDGFKLAHLIRELK